MELTDSTEGSGESRGSPAVDSGLLKREPGMLQQKTLLGEHDNLLKSDLLANGLLISKPGQGECKKEKNDALAKVIFTSEFKPSTCYKIKLKSQSEILPL